MKLTGRLSDGRRLISYFQYIFQIYFKLYNYSQKKVGVDDVEGPPVPIPNTEVKLNGAEDTLLVTTRENRKMPT